MTSLRRLLLVVLMVNSIGCVRHGELYSVYSFSWLVALFSRGPITIVPKLSYNTYLFSLLVPGYQNVGFFSLTIAIVHFVTNSPTPPSQFCVFLLFPVGPLMNTPAGTGKSLKNWDFMMGFWDFVWHIYKGNLDNFLSLGKWNKLSDHLKEKSWFESSSEEQER